MMPLQIQTRRVDCFRDLTSLMKSVASATVDSIEASLRVRTAEMSVTFLQQEYEKAKVEQESAEVYMLTAIRGILENTKGGKSGL